MIIFVCACFENVSDDCFFFCTVNHSIFILEKKSYCSLKKKREKKKLMGHHARFKITSFVTPVLRQKPPCFHVRAPITREILRTKCAQCKTK